MVMKKTLGRGLSQLMKGNETKGTDAEMAKSLASPVGSAEAPLSGVSKLMQGHYQPAEVQSAPEGVSNPFQQNGPSETVFSVRLVPDWIYYLSDVILLSAVLWMIILSPTAPTWVEWTTSLLLTVLAGLIGVYPWVRNVLGNDSPVQSGEIPQWSLASKTQPDGTEKVYVMHLHEPYTAVEITETSWSGVQPRPIWLSGSPDISPEDMKRLLMGAAEFYKKHQTDKSHSNSNVSAA